VSLAIRLQTQHALLMAFHFCILPSVVISDQRVANLIIFMTLSLFLNPFDFLSVGGVEAKFQSVRKG
jgi:hypothetical protein